MRNKKAKNRILKHFLLPPTREELDKQRKELFARRMESFLQHLAKAKKGADV